MDWLGEPLPFVRLCAAMRALGTVAGVRERAQRVAARIGAAVKRTAYVRSQ